MKPVYIDLLRHGEVDGEPALYGSTDVALKTEAILPMQRQLNDHPMDYGCLICSPKSRCLQFSRIFAEQHDVPLAVSADCAEYHFGQLDGISFDKADEQQRRWLDLFWCQPAQVLLPEAERFEEFSERVSRFWLQVATEAIEAQENRLVVSHGGVIKALLSQLLGISFGRAYQHLNIGYASLTRIQLWGSLDTARIQFIGVPAR